MKWLGPQGSGLSFSGRLWRSISGNHFPPVASQDLRPRLADIPDFLELPSGTPLASGLRWNATMLRLKPRQRAVFVDKMPDVANLAAASMLFGQFLADRPFSVGLGLAGLIAWALLWTFAIVLAAKEDQ